MQNGVCHELGKYINRLNAKKQTTELTSAKFQKMLRSRYIISRIQNSVQNSVGSDATVLSEYMLFANSTNFIFDT